MRARLFNIVDQPANLRLDPHECQLRKAIDIIVFWRFSYVKAGDAV